MVGLHPCRCSYLFTFLLGAGIDFEGVDGSSTGLVFRLFENFLRLRLSAANAPNPKKRSFSLSQLDSFENICIEIDLLYRLKLLFEYVSEVQFSNRSIFVAQLAN